MRGNKIQLVHRGEKKQQKVSLVTLCLVWCNLYNNQEHSWQQPPFLGDYMQHNDLAKSGDSFGARRKMDQIRRYIVHSDAVLIATVLPGDPVVSSSLFLQTEHIHLLHSDMSILTQLS